MQLSSGSMSSISTSNAALVGASHGTHHLLNSSSGNGLVANSTSISQLSTNETTSTNHFSNMGLHQQHTTNIPTYNSLSHPSSSVHGLHTSPSVVPSSPFGSPSNGADDGTILFIGDLSRTVKEEELHMLFSPFGTVVAIDIKRDKLTFNNLGYGFVQFSSRSEAQQAKKALNGYELNSRKIRIGWAQKNTTLFVGDLDGTITSEDLIRVFEVFGTIIAEESFVKEPSRKYGFVRFGSREDAERAKSEMNHKLLGSRPIRIGWGDSNFEKHCVHIQFDPNACHLQTGTNVNGIFHEQFFLDTFTPFAQAHRTNIVNISLPKHNHTKKLKGFAFIHYEENDAGEKAAILALQTLTSQYESPSSQQLQQSSSVPVNPLLNPSNPLSYVHHLQQSFSPRQGVGHHAPQSATPNNNTQQHVLGGIPVKFSFGKRQIFSRHRRANENHAAAVAASHGLNSIPPSMNMMMQGIPGAGMGTNHMNGVGGRGGSSVSTHRGGGSSPFGRVNATPSSPYNTSSNNAYTASSFMPFMQQANSNPTSNQLQLNSGTSRYHTNPQQQSYLAQQQGMHSSPSPDSGHSQQQAVTVQAQAAAATSWMIQNLAAQQFPGGLPAYQQLLSNHQTHSSSQPSNVSNHSSGGGLGSANAYYSPTHDSNTNSNHSNDSATSNLQTAANAYFSAQSQLFMHQQQHQHQQNSPSMNSTLLSNHNSLSHPSHSSMAQLMSEMSRLGIEPSAIANNSTNNHNAIPTITSGHSTPASSAAHAQTITFR